MVRSNEVHHRSRGLTRAVVAYLIQRRGSVLIGALCIVAISLAGAARLEMDYSVEQFFPDDGTERATYDRFRESFPHEDAQVVLLLEVDPEGARASHLRSGVAEVFRDVGLDDVHSAAPDVSLPELEGILWGSGGTVQAVLGYVPAELNDDVGRARIEGELSTRLEALELPAGSWTVTGTPLIRARVTEVFGRDQAILLGGGIVTFLVVLWVTLGGAAPAVAALATVLPAYLVTLGIMGFAGIPLTLLSGFTVVVVLVVGLCDVVHLMGGFRRALRHEEETEAAVLHAFSAMAGPCFYTSLTTAIGFGALALTGVDLVVDFGLFTALAVLLTWAFSMTVLPALLASRWAPTPSPGDVLTRTLERMSRHARRVAGARTGRRWVALTFAVVAGLSAFGITRSRIDTRLVDDLRVSSPILQDLRWAERRGFGVFQLNLFMEGADAEALGRPAMVRWMLDTEAWLRTQPLVMAALSPATALEVSPALARGLIDSDRDRAQILATVPDVGSARLVPLMDRVERRLSDVPPPMGSVGLTGTVTMAQTFSARLLRSFGPSLLLAVGLITALMMWMFRSVRLGALALLPNLFPLILLGGSLAALGIDLKPSTILIFSIAFGIAVDDSVHLMSRYTAARRDGLTAGDAMDTSLAEVGPALLLTTAMVTIGFSLLLLSSFQVLALIGGMSMLTAASAVAADLYLFPALFKTTRSERTRGPGGIGLPIGRGLEMRLYVRPGRRLRSHVLSRLTDDLRRVTAECLGGKALSYGVMSGDRSRMAEAVIVLLRRRQDGRPLGFTATTLLPVMVDGKPRQVLHIGLSMVVPELQRCGVTRLLVSLPPAVVLLRSGFRPVWVTNVSQVPAAVGLFGESVADLHPRMDGLGRPADQHREIAEALLTRHRAAFGVGEDARFDPGSFVIRNAYTGGSDALKKDWPSAQRHRDARWNRLCREKLDYDRGDDLLQIGRMTVGQTARVLGRFLVRAVRIRTRRQHDRSAVPRAGIVGEGVA